MTLPVASIAVHQHSVPGIAKCATLASQLMDLLLQVAAMTCTAKLISLGIAWVS